MKTNTPKRIYVRQIGKGKLSCGEYIRAKWHNIVDPFDPNDVIAVKNLSSLIDRYKTLNNREIEFVPYSGTKAVEILREALSLDN